MEDILLHVCVPECGSDGVALVKGDEDGQCSHREVDHTLPKRQYRTKTYGASTHERHIPSHGSNGALVQTDQTQTSDDLDDTLTRPASGRSGDFTGLPLVQLRFSPPSVRDMTVLTICSRILTISNGHVTLTWQKPADPPASTSAPKLIRPVSGFVNLSRIYSERLAYS